MSGLSSDAQLAALAALDAANDLIAARSRSRPRKSNAGARWPNYAPGLACPRARDELKWGWALDAICEHLEASPTSSIGEILRLLINVPPGSMKSLLVRRLLARLGMGPARQCRACAMWHRP
jgi:hypothetical protein